MPYCGKGGKTARGIFYPASAKGGNENKKQGNGFFIWLGLRPGDVPKLKKIAIELSMTVQAGLLELYALPVPDFLELVKEVTEVVHKRKRVSNGNQNSRRHR